MALPEFVNVMFCDVLAPMATFPKLRLVGLEVNAPVGAVVPVPLSAIVNGLPEALLVTVIFPVALPIAVGANFTVIVALWDGFNVAGVANPLTLNPLPPATVLEICAAAVPVFVSVIVCVPLLPSATFPKLRLPGLAPSFPNAAVDPVPVRGTLILGLVGSLVVKAIVPFTAPVTVGEKLTLIGKDCPAESVCGVVIPLTPNSDPFNVITEITKSEAPLFPTVRVDPSFDPIETVPKSIAAGATIP